MLYRFKLLIVFSMRMEKIKQIFGRELCEKWWILIRQAMMLEWLMEVNNLNLVNKLKRQFFITLDIWEI